MIEIIKDILKAEGEAEQAVTDARAQAKRMIADNALAIDRMYNDAAVSLRAEVEKLLQDAEIEATALEQAFLEKMNTQTERTISSARLNFDRALEIVEETITGRETEETKTE